MSDKKAYDFAYRHQDWITKTLNALPSAIPFNNNTKLTLFGDPVEIRINHDHRVKRTSIIQTDDALIVNTYQQDPRNRIMAHLKNLANSGLADMASDKAEIIGKTIKTVAVRDTKTRWGSCSSDACLSFSWRLIFAPYHAIDYVVAHEVAHLVHMDHSKKFWALCRKLSINYMDGKYWMQNHGNELMRYGKHTE